MNSFVSLCTLIRGSACIFLSSALSLNLTLCRTRACGRAGRWEHSLALMDEMRSEGVEPGEGCNVMALKACAAAGRWEQTLEMLEDMRASGVNRSESSFVVAMKACGDAGRLEEALGLMDDMRRDGVPPMETTYTTAVRNAAGGRAGLGSAAVGNMKICYYGGPYW